MGELRVAGLVRARRGSDGGYELAANPTDIDLGAILAAVGSPVALEHLELEGEPTAVADLWLALRGTVRDVLERVTLADLAGDTLPEDLRRLAQVEGAARPDG